MQGILESRNEGVADGSSDASSFKDARILKNTVFSRGGSNLKVAHKGRTGNDTRKGSNYHISLKSDAVATEDRGKLLPTAAGQWDQESNCGHSLELRTGAQAGGIADGAPRPIERSGRNYSASNFMYPGVVSPWEKGQDSAIQSEADLRNPDSADELANRAWEDFILEKAEHLKAKRKLIEEQRTLKRTVEPSQRKSHWDFVLEEMRWMANDFWQERTWKRCQAAHVCLEIAMKKGEDEFLAARLLKEQRRISSSLARVVEDFWHGAEVTSTKEKSDVKCSTKQQYNRSTNEGSVMSSNENSPLTKEAVGTSVHVEKSGLEQPSGIMKFAVQLLKELGSDRIRHAEDPSITKRYRDSNSILDLFFEVPLFYKVPVGAMETYRTAVEVEYAMIEEEYEKKKRNKVFKTGSVGARSERSGLQGILNSEVDLISPATGKSFVTRCLGPNNLTGSIPVKRQRSSATYLRPRGKQLGSSPGADGLMAKKQVGLQSQQDDGLDLDDSSEGDIRSDTPSSKLRGVDGKPRKIIKMKSYERLSFEGELAGGTSVKDLDVFSMEPGHEHVKQKAGLLSDTFDGSDSVLDLLGASGPQVILGQQNSKKQKSLKHGEANFETVLTFGLLSRQQLASVVDANKLVRQTSVQDSHRRVRPFKVPLNPSTGVSIPWSAGEDQDILALVHHLGTNWDLVSDVLSSNSQTKGIYRKPQRCKERHEVLVERGGMQGLENAEDLSTPLLQVPKGIIRGSWGQSAAEENTLKHIEQIVIIMQKYGARKTPNNFKDQKVLQVSHPSHGITISQFCADNGGPANPVQLADWVTSTGDGGGHSHPLQGSQGNVLGSPSIRVMPGLGMRPLAGGPPILSGLQGPNGSHLGGGPVSSAAMSAAAARGVQRLTMNFINLPSEEAVTLQMSADKLTETNAQRAWKLAGSGASGVSVLEGLSNSNGLLMLPSSTGGRVLVELIRGVSPPRAGSMRPLIVSSMGTACSNVSLPSSGNFVISSMTRGIAWLMNTAWVRGLLQSAFLSNLWKSVRVEEKSSVEAGSLNVMLVSQACFSGVGVGNVNQGLVVCKT